MFAQFEVRGISEKTVTQGDRKGEIDVFVQLEATDEARLYRVKLNNFLDLRPVYEKLRGKRVVIPVNLWSVTLRDGGSMCGLSLAGDGKPQASFPALQSAA